MSHPPESSYVLNLTKKCKVVGEIVVCISIINKLKKSPSDDALVI